MRKLILSLVVLIGSASQAQELTPLMNVGLDFGGDEIVRATYSDGSTSTIEAGRGILLSGGAVVGLAQSFEAQGTLGVKWTSTKEATNGAIDFTRIPIEILGYYKNADNRYRVGAGVTYQLGNKIKGSQAASSVSLELENALGFLAEGNYFFGANSEYAAGVRYTKIEYKAASGGPSVDGSSIGANFTYTWR